MNRYKLAILIPHYNNPQGLYSSIKSINVDDRSLVVIIDDGSNIELKPNKKTLDSFSKESNLSIVYKQFDINQGIERALNFGLKYIIEEHEITYIARLDCGDVCKKERFIKQLEFLDFNKNISLVGTCAEVVDEAGNLLYNLKVPTLHKQIRRKMHVMIGFVHPTIMFRTSVINELGYYPMGYTTAEDYAFLFRIVNNRLTANIPESLLYKERSGQSVSTTKRRKQLKTRFRVILDFGSFNIFYLYGLLRTATLFLIPYRLMERIKEKIL